MTYSYGPRWEKISLRDKPFLIHPNDIDDLSGAIKRDGDFWEADILDYIAQEFPVHGTIIDVGANIGNHTIYFSRFLDFKKMYSFEPEYDNYVLLTNNIFTNNIERKTHPIQAALSDRNGEIYIHKNRENFGAHEVGMGIGNYLVNCYKLDYFAFSDVTLLKIDAEWHEPQVLDGARETIKRCEPLILIEDSEYKYISIMNDLGYKVIKQWHHHKTYLYGRVV